MYQTIIGGTRKQPIYTLVLTLCIGQIAISCKVICVVKEVILQEHTHDRVRVYAERFDCNNLFILAEFSLPFV